MSILSFCLACGASAQTAKTAQISGTVLDEAGKPVDFVFVSVTRTPYDPKDGPASAGFTTGTPGTFAFSNLMAATYAICAYTAPVRGYLDTCEWGQQQNVTVTAGQTASGLKVVLGKGALVEFQVSDPKGLRPTSDTSATLVRLGLRSTSGAHTARFHGTFQGGLHHYIMNVPVGRQVQLLAESQGIDVKDEQGQKVPTAAGGPPAGVLTPFVLNAGQSRKFCWRLSSPSTK